MATVGDGMRFATGVLLVLALLVFGPPTVCCVAGALLEPVEAPGD